MLFYADQALLVFRPEIELIISISQVTLEARQAQSDSKELNDIRNEFKNENHPATLCRYIHFSYSQQNIKQCYTLVHSYYLTSLQQYC